MNALIDAHAADPECGYRFLTDEAAEAGQPMSERTGWALCHAQGLYSAISKKRKGNRTRPGPPVHDDLLQRAFTADAPNQVWVTDITEHPTGEGKLYLCTIKDLCGNRVVGYSMSGRMKASLAVAALKNAVANRSRNGQSVTGCIVHSDRGSHFRANTFLRTLDYHQLKGSMGRVGAAGDNAAAESFFSLLQNNVLDTQPWPTRAMLRMKIITWIEGTYHHRRRQRRLGKLTPLQYETKILTQAQETAA